MKTIVKCQQTANSKQQTANSVYFAEKRAVPALKKNPSKKRLTDKNKVRCILLYVTKLQKVV